MNFEKKPKHTRKEKYLSRKKKQAKIKRNLIVLDGEKINIAELSTEDIKNLIEYIYFIKSRKGGLPAAEPPKKHSKRKKILVIDDEQDVCEILYSFLAPHHYKVFLAFNGLMGIEYFGEVKPDLILLDLKMPDMDGLEVLKIIRKVSRVPVVIITGHPKEVSEIHLSGQKIEGYIEKPIYLKTVLNTIKHIIGE